jgi:hypothetical protein
MQFNSIASALGALALLFTTLQPAQADIRIWHLRGEVTTAEDANRFGLQIGDKLVGHVALDTAKLTGQGFETLSPEGGEFLDVGFQIGRFSFDESDDRTFFGPAFVFENGELVTMLFHVFFQLPEFDTPDLITFYDFIVPVDTFAPHFMFAGPGIEDVVGALFIPEPGTLALFGAGLAGIAALRRRRAASRPA